MQKALYRKQESKKAGKVSYAVFRNAKKAGGLEKVYSKAACFSQV